MTVLEAAVLVILMLLALPDFCRRIGRPGLLYPLYIVAGVVAGAFMHAEVRQVWREVGQFGFVLLLFSVGLEIELPEKRESLTALRRAGLWMAWQIPLGAGLARLAGIGWTEGLVAGAALAGTSVGMVHHVWQSYPFTVRGTRKRFLEWIVAVEVLAILLLSFSGPILQGTVWWQAVLKFLGIVGAVILAALIAARGAPHLTALLARFLHIQSHFLVVVLFAIAALGERLGLSAPKTAFVLGMFISRSTHEEAELNHRLEPIRDRMFVPVFFFGLGTLVEPGMLWSRVFGLAIPSALLLFGARHLVYFRWFARLFHTTAAAHIMTAPVLTIAAVAVEVLAGAHASPEAITWTLAAGLSLTLLAAFNRVGDGPRLTRLEPAMAAPEAWAEAEREPGGPHAPV